MSVPNQRVVVIEKDKVTTPPFVQINQDDWTEAFKNLTRSAFGIYLYLAQNAKGYKFEYSPTAIENLGIMTKGTATKVYRELEEKGYIEEGHFYVSSKNKREQKTKIQNEINKTIRRY